MIKNIKSIFILLTLSSTIFCNINFVVLDENKDEIIYQVGSNLDKRFSPCSTFKIPLCFMGYDEKILLDEEHPTWEYKKFEYEEPDVNLLNQTPATWITKSIIWYSRILTAKLGLEVIKKYLSIFNYGNQDFSGDAGKNNGLTNAWLTSSLKISPFEQINFLKQFVNEGFAISKESIRKARKLLFIESLENNWMLFGKTGTNVDFDELEKNNNQDKVSWFVGWVENKNKRYLFCLLITDCSKFPTSLERKEMVKKYLQEIKIFDLS